MTWTKEFLLAACFWALGALMLWLSVTMMLVERGGKDPDGWMMYLFASIFALPGIFLFYAPISRAVQRRRQRRFEAQERAQLR